MCALLCPLVLKLNAAACASGEALACPPATLTLEVVWHEDATYMKTSVDVGAQTHLVRRPVVLDGSVQNVVLELPAGLLLRVVGGVCADTHAQQRADGLVLTVAGETLEYVVASGSAEFNVCFDVGPQQPFGCCSEELRGCAVETQRLVSAPHLSTAAQGGGTVVSLQAMEHHLSQLDAMLSRLDRMARGVLVGVQATAASPALDAFGGHTNYVLSE